MPPQKADQRGSGGDRWEARPRRSGEWETPIEKSALLEYVDDSDDLEVFRVEGELFAD